MRRARTGRAIRSVDDRTKNNMVKNKIKPQSANVETTIKIELCTAAADTGELILEDEAGDYYYILNNFTMHISAIETNKFDFLLK